MCMTFKPSGGTAWETVMLLGWIYPHESRSTLENGCHLTQSAVANGQKDSWNMSTFWLDFRKYERQILVTMTKKKTTTPSRLLSGNGAKAIICDDMGAHQHKGLYWDFRGIQCVAIMATSFPGKSVHISAEGYSSKLSKRQSACDWPVCSRGLFPIENIWHILKRWIRQQWPWTAE